MYKKGFTLIELLVVIAIIGILSSVVLASLNSARNKGADAAVKSNLAAIRSQAEIYNDDKSGYTTGGTNVGSGMDGAVGADVTPVECASQASSMFSDPVVTSAISKAKESSRGKIVCSATGTAYGVAAALIGKANTAWCVDNTSVARETTVTAGIYADMTGFRFKVGSNNKITCP